MTRPLKRRGKLAHLGIMFANAASSVADAVRGLWAKDRHRRWLVPLMVFLCLTGLVLTVAATVQALAPFLYSIF